MLSYFVAHRPVLLREVLSIFNPRPGETYIDATINGGGHAKAILERIGPEGKLLGIDWDCGLIEKLRKKGISSISSDGKYSSSEVEKLPNLVLTCDNYANLGASVRKYNLDAPAGILFDLGFSSYHLESAQRGFSFLKDEFLDMRYSPSTNELTAEKIINIWPEEAIEDILRRYGEERFSRRIAAGIVRARQNKRIATTGELVEIIKRSVPPQYLRQRIHPATRTFQALRVAVNHELENLEKALPEALALLRPGGKIIVISFHSLEDRIVKQFFKEQSRAGKLEILTKKPLVPRKEEILLNPRARSAKLRAAIKK